jgi:DNA-binding NarL/FixJ family response regulator
VRIVIAEDMSLLRDGLARMLRDEGIEVVGQVDTAPGLLDAVDRERPDVALVDIKLPPTWTNEGLQAAVTIRSTRPGTAILLLSSYLDARFASSLLEADATHSGYLLKDHVADPAVLVDALGRVAAGESVVDPAVIAQLLERRRAAGPLDRLTDRQREILSLMAQGYSNTRICDHLVLSPRTVESHVRNIFTALNLAENSDGNRRVLAVLAYLRA